MKTKILSPLRRDGYKAGMIMMLIALSTMMLTTACSNEDDVVNNAANTETVANKGYALPVTVNVTRGDGATRASFDGGKLNFSGGDKLFVEGIDNSVGGAGRFAGTLTWQSGGTFSGTIYTQEQWLSTADALFTDASASGIVKATLLPNGYESYEFLSIYNNGSDDLYDDVVAWSMQKAFVASETAKATGVEQLSFEQATTYSSGFALAPANAILNFTISGLEAGAQNVTLSIDYGGLVYPVTGSVTPNASGVATFAIGVPVGANIKDMDNNLTVGTHNFTLPSSTTFTAGKIYNITRNAIPTGAINGQFSVSDTKKVYFSKGNLQATYNTSWSWAFATNQWDCIGNAAGNTSINGVGTISGTGTVDLFGWVGAACAWTGAAQYGISNVTVAKQYGNVAGEALKSDWGTLAITNGGNTANFGWHSLASSEWEYLFKTRTTPSGVRYAHATVNDVPGLVLLPDDWSTDYYSLDKVNDATGTAYTDNVISSSDWTSKLEAHGAVFLPAGGYRSGAEVNDAGVGGNYWSSTPSTSALSARYFFFGSAVFGGNTSNSMRNRGCSVRLVYNAN